MFLFLYVFLFLEGWIYKMKYKTTTRLTFKLFSVFTNFLPNIFSSNFYCGCTKCLVDNTPSSANTNNCSKRSNKNIYCVFYMYFFETYIAIFNALQSRQKSINTLHNSNIYVYNRKHLQVHKEERL